MNVYFYLPDFKSLDLNNPFELSKKGGVVVWSVLVYYFLKKYGYEDIYLTETIPEGKGLLFFHPRFTNKVFKNPNLFYVCTLADAKNKIKKADFHIVQNPSLVDKTSFYIPHFPQPELLPRNKKGIENISFKGESQNLHPDLQKKEFQEKIKTLKMNFFIDTKKDFWGDYSNVDITLAIRQNRKNRWKNKPITKLINAWFAKTPAIVGDEVAFEMTKKRELDYLKAINEKEAFDAIKKLKENPSLYDDMVANGIERSKEYTFEKISYKWMNIIDDIKKEKKSWFKKLMQNRLL